MTRLPAPASLAQTISQLATQYAREDVQGRGWHSSGALQPYSAEGKTGIRSTVRYLLFQNSGIRPFIMWWVNGRTVPIKEKDGSTHLVRGKGAGTPGWVTLPGGVKKWRDQRWRHPGLAPKRFLENSISRAIRESHDDIQDSLMNVINGGDER